MKKAFPLLLLVFSCPAYASRQDVPQEFYACKQDSDCIVVSGICGAWEVINKEKRKDAEDYFGKKNSEVDCAAISTEKPSNPSRIGCNKGKCAIKPDAHGCVLRAASQWYSLKEAPCCFACEVDKTGFCKLEAKSTEACQY